MNKMIKFFKHIGSKLKSCYAILTHDRYYIFCAKKELDITKDNDVRVLINHPSPLISKAIVDFLKKC